MSAPLRGAAKRDELVVQMLGEMADRLEARRPDEPITAVGRIALIQATTMDPVLAPELRTRCPEITSRVSRRDYAAQLRQIVGERAVSAQQKQPCGSCQGAGGTVVDTSDGATRQHWQTCSDCQGRGPQGGGSR